MGIKISELAEANLPLDSTEDLPIVQDGTTVRCSVQDVANLARPYLVYSAIISQSGTNPPAEVNVLENTLGAIIWTYDANGSYSSNTIGPGSQLFALIGGSNSSPNWVNVTVTPFGKVNITVANSSGLTDNGLNYCPIEIRLYQ